MPTHPFAHRRNRDNSYDSICTRCFVTVAHQPREEDLAAFEENHIPCDRGVFGGACGIPPKPGAPTDTP